MDAPDMLPMPESMTHPGLSLDQLLQHLVGQSFTRSRTNGAHVEVALGALLAKLGRDADARAAILERFTRWLIGWTVAVAFLTLILVALAAPLAVKDWRMILSGGTEKTHESSPGPIP